VPENKAYSHEAKSLKYLMVGGGEARLLVQRENRGRRAGLAVME
jgi:hypothetical protein